MAGLSLRHINKRFSDQFEAVKDFNLDIQDREFLILVGPSGCGKSTTLRMIAGLEEPTSGEIWIGDKMVNDVEAKDRDVAMVFQNFALYPYKSVYDNLAFGLKMRKVSKGEIKKKVAEVARILDLENLLDRKPRQLSGGQRQRVAMGRAMVRNPKVFLMDEPLSNLDAKLRGQMRSELSRLHKKLEATIVYVTHDQTEAMTLGSRIVVMKDGEIQQVDTPQVLYNEPCNQFVAGFIGSPQMNFMDVACQLSEVRSCLLLGDTELELPVEKAARLAKAGVDGETVTLGIRPEHVEAVRMDEAIGEGQLAATVSVYEMLGAEAYLEMDVNGQILTARVDAATPVRVGDTVSVTLNMEKVHIFDKKTGQTITN